MYTLQMLITALGIFNEYSNDDANPIFFDGNELVITNVDTNDVPLLQKEKLISLGFEEYNGYFRSGRYTFIP